MWQQSWYVGWGWTWAGIGMILLLVLPLIMGGRYRLPYLATLCLAGICSVIFLWIHNQNTPEMAGWIATDDTSPVARVNRGITLLSGASGLGIVYRQHRLGIPSARRAAYAYDPDPRINAARGSPDPRIPKYPGDNMVVGPSHPIVLRRAGFTIIWRGEPDRPSISIAHLNLIAFPNWFAISVLSIPVAYWIYKRKWGLRKYRRKHNLCESCGYSLQGLPEPVRCPECGTPRSVEPKTTPPATLTPSN